MQFYSTYMSAICALLAQTGNTASVYCITEVDPGANAINSGEAMPNIAVYCGVYKDYQRIAPELAALIAGRGQHMLVEVRCEDASIGYVWIWFASNGDVYRCYAMINPAARTSDLRL